MDTKEILKNLCAVEGVTGAYYLDKNRNLADFSAAIETDTEYVAGVILGIIDSGRKIGEAFDMLPLNQSNVEFGDSSLALDILKDESALALVSTKGANLGRIRLEMRKAKKTLESAMV